MKIVKIDITLDGNLYKWSVKTFKDYKLNKPKFKEALRRFIEDLKEV